MNQPKEFFSAFANRLRPSDEDLLEAVNGYPEREQARDLLSTRQPAELTEEELRSIVGGNLFLLKPGAFLYFLPAILTAITVDYPALTVITSELLGLLAPPAQGDCLRSGVGLAEEMVALSRSLKPQLIDSGILADRFTSRVKGVSREEGRAILLFLEQLRDRYGDDFPDGAIDKAIAYWDKPG